MKIERWDYAKVDSVSPSERVVDFGLVLGESLSFSLYLSHHTHTFSVFTIVYNLELNESVPIVFNKHVEIIESVLQVNK